MSRILRFALLAFLSTTPRLAASTNVSIWAAPGASGRILQRADPLGNRVLDYSGVGYKSGLAPLPNVPAKVTISPVPGDNVANVQGAINQVSAMIPDTNGFRGAVVLNAGEYPLASTVRISASGVVLRGVGSGTNGTVLRATGSSQYTLVSIAGSGSATNISGTTHNITNQYVPVGSRSLNVDSTSGLAVGDHVFVRRVATSNWIHDLGMDLLCCEPSVSAWTPGGYNIDSDRIITRLEGTHIFLDAPLTCAIDRAYTNGTIRKYSWPGRIQNSGIEHLRGVSNFTNSTDENHGWTFVQFNSIENGWARNVTSQNFGYSCVSLSSGARFVTVVDCQSLDPISQITGGRRYAFVLDDCNMCLVQNCYNKLDRHQFVTQSLTTGPNVFVDGLSDSAQADAGPHHRWGTGALWDCVVVNGNNLNIQNRGNLGSGHGWSGANEVAWNCDADGGFVVQNPPTAHNWLIGSLGAIENGTVYVGPHDPGTYDSHGSNVFPNSLYYAQLQDRLAAPGLQAREYWVGQIGRFTNNAPGGEPVPVNPAWTAAIQTAAGGAAIDGFDLVAGNHWVPFTFNFSLATNEHIVGASLSVSLLAASAGATNDLLYLDHLTNAFSFGALGWLPVSAAVSNPTVRILDLSSQLNLLADGQLNVAVQNDIGVDWALLELQVGPNINAGTTSLAPAGDATVRGGASATSNFGTATTLTTKEDALADNDRRTFLRWDLTGVTGIVYQARVRLTPISVGTNAIEQGVSFVTNDAWSENTITWNNQPAAGKRFATWIPGANAPLEFVVTPQVLDALAGDKQLSLQLFSLRNFGAAGTVDYASREYSDPASRPQLLLTVSELPPIVSGFTNISIPVNASTGPLPFTISDDKSDAADLTLMGASSNTNLVPAANIVFGGSGSNRTVTVSPALNGNGQAMITIVVTDTAGLSSSQSFILTVSSHPPSLIIWNGPGAGAHPWSSAPNWSPATSPEALDDVRFFDPGAAGVAVSNINNVVDAAFVSAIASLQYGPTNGNHTTLIVPGQELAIANGLSVGTGTDNGNAQVVNATLTGPGAGLTLLGGDFLVRQATDAATSGSQRATLNLSGLDSLDGSINRLVVGSEGSFARVVGTLFLAKTNRLTASGGSPAIAVGGAAGGNGNAGGSSFVYLGKSNAIFADSLSVGRGKQGASGGVPSSFRFNPAFTNANPALGATVFLRAADGVGRMSNWTLADSQSGGGTVNTAGACDFTGGTVDAQVNTIVVAKSSSGTGVGSPAGSLTMQAGTIDVNTLQLGYQSLSGSNSASGTANINGGRLQVNSALELAHVSGGSGATNTGGTLNINGGTAGINSIVVGAGAGPTMITIKNGVLILTNTAGTSAAPIGILALTNAELQLAPGTNAPAIVTGNLLTGVGGNTITLSSAPPFSSYPAQFKLIQYSGAIGGAGFNFSLAPITNPPICGAYLSNNPGSVDLVITNCVGPFAPAINSIILSGPNLVVSGSGGSAGGNYYVLTSTNIALPLVNWTRVATNTFGAGGTFNFTNTVNPGTAQSFFALQLP